MTDPDTTPATVDDALRVLASVGSYAPPTLVGDPDLDRTPALVRALRELARNS